MKVVINRCFGGFGLSEQAFEEILKRKGVEYDKQDGQFSSLVGADYYEKGHAGDDEYYISAYDYYNDRADPDLIEVVEQLGDAANGRHAELAIVEIPDDVEWLIDEYDGREHVAEAHRTWY